jgi:DNA mismatch repair protein MutL
MSDIIHVLPDAVANQIAAGEVVQRPASVVKELIENAIDAGADKIQLIVQDAGKSLIQVIDNGSGMSPSDAERCFERHATSKIKKAEDLFAIRSMGFRGEAMASIAAVAHVVLKTRREEDELGVQIQMDASQLTERTPIASPKGTNIAVKNLFYNIPARRHFLKSNSVELRHIIDEFQRIAIAHPEVHLRLESDGGELYHLPAEGLKQRLVHVFGNHYNQRLVPVAEDTSILQVEGFVGKPEFAKRTRGEQFFYVNKRFIKDPYLHHAVMNAYEEILQPDTYPLYVLFIEIDPSKIDINVHPTKTELKYEDEKAIYAIIRSAVKRSLGRYNIAPTLDFQQETGFSQMIQPKPLDQIKPPSIQFNPDFNPFDTDKNNGLNRSASVSSYTRNASAGIPDQWANLYQITEEVQSIQLPLLEEEKENNLNPQQSISKQLFQLHNRYIVSQIHSGFILIDQQAAHERILYEQFLLQLQTRQGASQQLLFPQTVTLNPSDFALMQELLPEIQLLGFQISVFGKNTLIIEGIPAELPEGTQELHLIESILEDFKNKQNDVRLPKRDKLARSLARTTSLKAGALLTNMEMANLIDQLFACESANVSLQGKPILLTFTLMELKERFDRS